jgi:ubiquinone/menaquinone biosynthesis C-methylase UbiE
VAERSTTRLSDWQFAAFHEDEDRVRDAMIDWLGVSARQRVLEVGCGTGRDSSRLARRLGAGGALFMQDLSPPMVQACIGRMQRDTSVRDAGCAIEYSVSNARHLPFADDSFDAVFHSAGSTSLAICRRRPPNSHESRGPEGAC